MRTIATRNAMEASQINEAHRATSALKLRHGPSQREQLFRGERSDFFPCMHESRSFGSRGQT
jgi:hypothetical protein